MAGFLPWLVALVCLVSCDYRVDKSGELKGPGPGDDWYQWLDSRIFVKKCSMCHMGKEAAAGVDVSSRDALVATGPVIPGNPEGSRLFDSLAKGRMPKGAMGPLSSAEIAVVRQWILRGAPGPGKPEELPEPTFRSLRSYFERKACLGCHGVEKKEADLDLTTYEGWMANFGVVVPGAPEESSLYLKVDFGEMPPTDPPQPLPKAAVEALRKWIADGAKEN